MNAPEKRKPKTLGRFLIVYYYQLTHGVTRFIIMPILLIIAIFGALIANSDRIPLFSYKLYAVESGSMEPTLYRGDLVVVQAQSSYQIDDIVTFYPNSDNPQTYTHRIIEIDKSETRTRYQTKGDNNENPDPFPIGESNIEGEVVASIDWLGTFVLFSRTYFGIILFIIIPVTILLTLQLNSLAQWWHRVYLQARNGS